MKTLALLFVALAASTLSFAQDMSPESGPCETCTTAASNTRQKCEIVANDAAAREACAKRYSEMQLGCQLNACKPGQSAPESASCPGCQHRVSEEERACRQMNAASQEQIACNQRASRMRARCDEGACKQPAPK